MRCPRLITLSLCVLSLVCVCPALAAPVVVLVDGDSRVVFSDRGTVLEITCRDVPVACDTGFSLCADAGIVGVLGEAAVGLQPGTVEFVAWYSHGIIPVILHQTITDGATGAPLYDLDLQDTAISDGTPVYLVLNNHPAPGYCVGVHEFYRLFKGRGKLCVKRKFYNACRTPIRICGVKEFARFCSPQGSFAVHNSTAEASLEDVETLRRLFLDPDAGNNASSIKAGSVAAADVGSEWSSCALTSDFSQDQEIGDRWLELFADFRPGCVTLAPSGRPGYEKFVNTCLTWLCDDRPPGGGCIWQCVPE